jgi:hypothetical protein
MLDAERVTEIFIDCLFREDEAKDNPIVAEGIVGSVGFHPERLETHKDEIALLLAELPNEFQEKGGGGMSFLNACMDKNGYQWGEHIHMEQLFQLGIGIKAVKCLLPRAMWNVLPGGMPYYVVKN